MCELVAKAVTGRRLNSWYLFISVDILSSETDVVEIY
jgi:hypothetical protein